MTDGQLCRPVARRKRQVQRQIDHAVLGAVTRARVALAPRRSDAVDVLAADGGFRGVGPRSNPACVWRVRATVPGSSPPSKGDPFVPKQPRRCGDHGLLDVDPAGAHP